MPRLLALLFALLFVLPAHAASEEKKPDTQAEDIKERFLKMDPFNAPLPPNDKGQRRQIFLMIELQIPDPDKVSVVAQRMPKLRDAFIRELYSRPVGTPEGLGPSEMDELKRRLLAQGRKVLGKELLDDVLIVNAMRIGGG